MLIQGRAVTEAIYKSIRSQRQADGLASTPKIAIIQVGNHAASNLYIRNKIQACKNLNFSVNHLRIDSEVPAKTLTGHILRLNQDPSVHGILLQLPLPPHLNPLEFLGQIDPTKDVDGITPHNMGLLAKGNAHIIPCTAMAICKILDHAQYDITGKHAVIVGASNIVGKPTSLAFLARKATVTVCHSATVNLANHVQAADLLVVAIGNPNVIQTSWLHKDQVVIDVGINYDQNNQLIGDINTLKAADIVNMITPVPGGVGPCTVACVALNLYQLFINQETR
ncbi:MAG: bifunctional 5,10-methylenetetrahydrofolate dehydrogenase/5,10-methenyltetrahydrofolate cyclohydrolase [Pseudomonadota bacterium]|nr:bifunctional 5,10-methylenetetrahydrofolate dehydrogenase/5,10-methenyltetrahydrofolate cyclohydrolase [Pseudomonadota bacterium]MEC8978422.1 bifunctional 5,10-methylenetetrahydrofolate dehydrogenase/5,10-methenyltetrahydrofolate cyclohydrolase [Pseudomonadota bacterium]